MANDLDRLIDLARKYRQENGLSDEERTRQIRSFAFGNTHLENDAITKSDIDSAMDSLRVARESDGVCS